MTSILGLCDVNAAAALTKHQLKQKVAILFDAGDVLNSTSKLSPLLSPSMKDQMLQEPVIANLVVADDGQSPAFIKALLMCPGSPQQEVAPSTASIENNVVSLAYFKERNKNKLLTKMSASSKAMCDAMLQLKQKGFVKELYCHQTGTSTNSKM